MMGRIAHSVLRLGLLAAAFTSAAAGVELKPETVAAFDRYIRQAEPDIRLRIASGDGFLFATPPERRSSLRAGIVLAVSRNAHRALRVKSGLIHDWVGAVFIPGVSVASVISLVQDYDHHSRYYGPEVVASKLLERNGNDFRVYLRLLKKKVLTVVLDTEHAVHYVQLSETRWWSSSRSTRISELRDPGTKSERRLPPDTGQGFLWRLNSYWTFQERDGGTYVECEAISLTRDAPRALKLLIDPIVRELPYDSLLDTLKETRAAALRTARN
jgi:hypothetical protein